MEFHRPFVKRNVDKWIKLQDFFRYDCTWNVYHCISFSTPGGTHLVRDEACVVSMFQVMLLSILFLNWSSGLSLWYIDCVYLVCQFPIVILSHEVLFCCFFDLLAVWYSNRIFLLCFLHWACNIVQTAHKGVDPCFHILLT